MTASTVSPMSGRKLFADGKYRILAQIMPIIMEIINLGEQNSILNSFIAQMRDRTVQKDSMRFRANLERVGAVFAYEISKRLHYSEKKVVTPLGIADVPTYDDQIVVATILRAGLPLHRGILDFLTMPRMHLSPHTENTTKGMISI